MTIPDPDGTLNGIRYAIGAANDEREVDVNNNVNNYYTWVAYSVAHQTIGLRYVNTKAGDVGAGPSETLQQIDANLDLHLAPVNLILGYFKAV